MFIDFLYEELMERAGGDLTYAKELLEELTTMVNNAIEQEEPKDKFTYHLTDDGVATVEYENKEVN